MEFVPGFQKNSVAGDCVGIIYGIQCSRDQYKAHVTALENPKNEVHNKKPSNGVASSEMAHAQEAAEPMAYTIKIPMILPMDMIFSPQFYRKNLINSLGWLSTDIDWFYDPRFRTVDFESIRIFSGDRE